MKKDKVIKKLSKKIKDLSKSLANVEKNSAYIGDVNANAIEVICSYLGIEHEVDMDGLYVAGEKVSGEIFTKKEMEEMVKRNNWPISTGCQCKGIEISGNMHVNDSGIFRVEDDDGMEEEDGK